MLKRAKQVVVAEENRFEKNAAADGVTTDGLRLDP